MRKQIQDLYEKAGQYHHQAMALLDAAGKDGLSAEDTAQFDKLLDDVERITNEAKALEQRQERAQTLGGELGQPANRLPSPRRASDAEGGETDTIKRKAFRSYLMGGMKALSPEQKDLLAGSDTDGGFLVGPQQFVGELIKFVDDTVAMRQVATTYQINSADSLGVVSLDVDVGDADWTAEVQQTSVDNAMRVGGRELKPHPLSKEVKISKTLLRKAALNPEQLVQQRLAYKFGVTMEKAYMSGDGAQKPLGVFVPSTQGIDSSRDIAASGATSFTADNWIDVRHGIKEQYIGRPGTRWMLHRDILRALRKLKDGNGQYLWAPGLAGGVPNTILEVPYTLSEFAPNSLTSGAYVAILGDFSFYWIVDALNMEVQVLLELYARTNQTGYIARAESDGMPVLAEAFVRLKMA